MMLGWLVRLSRVRFEEVRYEVKLFSKVTLDCNESFASSRNRSYTTQFSYQQRQENKAKLACLVNTNFDFVHNFVYIFHSMPSLATAPKMLVGTYQRHHWEIAMIPIDANWGGSISWTMNKSPSTQNTVVAFYPGVYRGVIYISAGKAVSEEI